MNYKIKNPKLVFTILFALLLLLFILVYHFIIYDYFAGKSFTKDLNSITSNNKNTVFKVNKILLYNSASPNNQDKEQAIEKVNLSQFSDIGIYLDNTSYIFDLTDENTIKSMYIDNISITPATSNSDSDCFLSYKNPNNFGKLSDLYEYKNQQIHFNIISDNKTNSKTNYSKPTFYNDCSNPITLGFINQDCVENYTPDNFQNTLSFDGKCLFETDTDISSLNYKLSFTIYILNNLNQKFSCNVKLNIDLTKPENKLKNDGYTYSTYSVDYPFFSL